MDNAPQAGDRAAAAPALTVLVQVTPPPLRERPPLDPASAAGIAALFKILASDTRLRLLHALTRSAEVRVTDLAIEVAMSPQAVSNQLQRLVDQRIVATRRDGTNIYYRVVDRCIPRLLELGWCLYDTTQQPTD
jgi:ArsR family transcriptional regulator, lead/cadmium/zinc/bismuth-responsive transcriptional repressor